MSLGVTAVPPKRYLVLEVRQGLANRICAWISGLHLAEMIDREFLLVWPDEPACPCEFGDLFEATTASFTTLESCLAWIGASSDEIREHHVDGLSECLRGLDIAQSSSRVLVLRAPFFCYERADRVARADFARLSQSWASEPFADEKTIAIFDAVLKQLRGPLKKFVRRVVPRADICAAVDAFATDYFHGPVVGFHLRGTDNVRCDRLLPRFLETIERMTAHKDCPAVFIAGDHSAAVSQAVAVSHGRALTYVTTHDPSKFRQTPMRESLADMLLLARTSRIYKPPFSTFTIVSAAIGDVPLTVIHEHWIIRLPAALGRLSRRMLRGFSPK